MATNGNNQVGPDVCVVGAGVVGLVATKNLLEQGLNVTTFERHDHIGGTWHVSDNGEQTTALEQTRFNTSRQSCSYTDFPFPTEFPMHPWAKDLQKYLELYANNFKLLPHIQLSTGVDHIERDEASGKWLVYTKDTKTGLVTCRSFDRVAVATGMLNIKHTPKIKGIEKFTGDAIHSREFKDPSHYTGKNVLVVGVGATGADSTTFLVEAKAAKVYLSHRGQFFILPRVHKGKAFDHTMTRRSNTVLRALFSIFPRGCAALMGKALASIRATAFPWLRDHPSFNASRKVDGLLHRLPFFSEEMAVNLRDGHIETVLGIEEITGPKSITLTDGKVLEDIDAIIFCSGYYYDFSIIQGPGDPTDPATAPDHHKQIEATPFYHPEDRFARLYRGFLSEQYPESLAFLGHLVIMKPPIVLYDVITMALASVWTGGYPIEPAEERREDIDRHYRFMVDTLKRGPAHHLGLRYNSKGTYEWLNRVAGTGVTERLACWSVEAWKLWWNDRKFYNLLMDGTDMPPVYRLFDTGRGRKPWPGAREAIERTNAEVRALGEAWERENKKKAKKD